MVVVVVCEFFVSFCCCVCILLLLLFLFVVSFLIFITIVTNEFLLIFCVFCCYFARFRFQEQQLALAGMLNTPKSFLIRSFFSVSAQHINSLQTATIMLHTWLNTTSYCLYLYMLFCLSFFFSIKFFLVRCCFK